MKSASKVSIARPALGGNDAQETCLSAGGDLSLGKEGFQSSVQISNNSEGDKVDKSG